MAELLVVFGTRPEAIKLAPVVHALKDTSHHVAVCHSGQHAGAIDFVDVDIALELCPTGISLPEQTAHLQRVIDRELQVRKPDVVLVQGDTCTTMVAAMAAVRHAVPVAHVEAGLRTGRLNEPFPEELYRRSISSVAHWHFAPTSHAAENLERERIKPESIFIVGNTIVDALRSHTLVRTNGHRTILVTAHRRENWDDNFEAIRSLVSHVAQKFPDLEFVLPLHTNPAVQTSLRPLEKYANIQLVPAESHREFLERLNNSWAVITDSGGVQEEACALGVPCIVIRDATDRPEMVRAGSAILVGRDRERAERAVEQLHDNRIYRSMKNSRDMFGDGNAAVRIAKILDEHL